jgi:small glutamine-rich tetratricopeptide repeat-containing protein alpha
MAAASETTKKRLALAIIDYLNASVKDGSISSEEAESIEIATNCIGEAFKVDASDEAALKDAVGGQSLLSIYSVYEKLKGKSTPSTKGAGSAGEAPPTTSATSGGSIDAKTKEDADKLKAQGNAAMQKRDYTSAIDLYTQALNLNPLNPIYLSNRAAAYSGALRHEEAKGDAEMAVAADPSFAKAWSRLGLAKFALGDAKGSMEAYQKGIEAEGSGGSEAMRKGYETAKRKVEEEGGDSEEEFESSRDPMAGMGGGGGGMPDLSALAGMFGGGGAGGAGGGMPDMASLMNNPMMRQMAQNLMSNPEAMSGLLNNPRIAEMASQFGGGGGAGRGAGGGGGGGGMPDLASLMQDPSIRDM